MKKKLAFLSFLLITLSLFSKDIPAYNVISIDSLSDYLKVDAKKEFSDTNKISTTELAEYLRVKFSERYFYNWQDAEERFNNYQELYPSREAYHKERALDHMTKFQDSTNWKLPFNYLNGKPVNAYGLRHLARQHKMVDIAFNYYYTNKDPKYIDYFTRQMQSLNDALSANKYEIIEDGNGVYESFRSGYRILNWLQIHNMFLSQDAYSDEEQLLTIATLLQHGANLFAVNQNFHPGNHQTRGLSALAMISILLRDFEGTDIWYEHAMNLLEEHISKEINNDNFQFERSVHYHMSDIGNYYYVYQLAQINNIEVTENWESSLRNMFSTLVKISYPDKTTPVLQDDTDNPWSESNDISGTLTLGYLLFNDPVMGYFAKKSVSPFMYWYITNDQIAALGNPKKQIPEYKSLSFPTTGYYVMREGWGVKDKMMIITAGLDDKKPDHQHGDMLGVQAMAMGNIVLPNYQVRYSLKDYGFFKNSMVKNVALVDDELQGKRYVSNKGGSGFGKFKELPNPVTINWETNEKYDLFVGSHDGFKNVDVAYTRQVINIANDFWLVKDNFVSETQHTYKQIWQGHYTHEEQPNLIRSVYANGAGCDILQLRKIDSAFLDGRRGKQWSVLSKQADAGFSFITVIYPFAKYNDRINEENTEADILGWKINDSNWMFSGNNPISLTKEGETYAFDVDKLNYKDVVIELSRPSDLYLEVVNEKLSIHFIGDKELKVVLSGITDLKLDGSLVKKVEIIKPGNKIDCLIK